MQTDFFTFGSPKDRTRPATEVMNDIESSVSGFEWDFEGLIRTNGTTVQLPAESRVVSAIIEQEAIRQVSTQLQDDPIQIIPPEHSRQYPDMTLLGAGVEETRIALDIKTGRRDPRQKDRLDNRLTLGSYAGYFRNPNTDTQYTRFPYGDYDQHWVLALVYSWQPSSSGNDMVSDVLPILQPKWKLASRSSGSGTTSHIGSVQSIPELNDGRGEFDSKEEFESYWRSF